MIEAVKEFLDVGINKVNLGYHFLFPVFLFLFSIQEWPFQRPDSGISLGLL